RGRLSEAASQGFRLRRPEGAAPLWTPRLRSPVDAGLIVPLAGGLLLAYLALLPLFVLVWGGFQREVSPGELVPTLDNYWSAYSSAYTYSSFANSLVFAGGSAGLAFLI